MFAFKLVQTPRGCASCGTLVTSRLAGHHYQDPMCDPCFREAAPELVEAALALRPESSIQRLEAGRHSRCVDCGDTIHSSRFAGQHFADPLCTACFEARSPALAALLILHEAAVEAAAGACDALELLRVAINYAQVLYRLDARKGPRGHS